MLVRSPGFTLLICLNLALGIGATTAIFSVIDGVLLSPLPYPRADRLMAVYSQFPALGFERFWVSPAEYMEFRQRARTFTEVGAYMTRSVNLEGRDQPVRARAAYATESLFRVLGIDAAQGRVFSPDEDLPNSEPVAVLSDGLWRRAFGADPGVLGKRVRIDGRERTITGVMPAGFDIPGQRVELWLPLGIDPVEDMRRRGYHVLSSIGRLKSGATLGQAHSELEGLLARWKLEPQSDHNLDPEQHRLVIKPLLEDLVGDVRTKMLMLVGGVGLVLLIACLNGANLLLVRAEARQKEIALRVSLGAQRPRLLRQFLTESVLLSLLGGGLGVLLAMTAARAIVALNADSIPRVEEIGVDARAVIFTLVLSLLVGVIFGLAPAFHALGSSFYHALREGAQSATRGVAARWFRRTLVVAEIALASFLAITAGLLVKSFWALQQVDPGFEPRGLLTLQVSLPRESYPEQHLVRGFYSGLIERLAALPGVEDVAALSGLPPHREVESDDIELESVEPTPDGPPHHVDFSQFVSRDYFRTMRIPVLAGRAFEESDGSESPRIVVINQTMAKTFWPDRSPVGDRLRRGGPNTPWSTIIGVAADVKQAGLDQNAGNEIYYLNDQVPARTQYLVVRAHRDPLALAGSVRDEIRRIDPSLPVAEVRTMEQVIFDSVARPRFLMVLVLMFSAIALGLVAVGTYGILSHTVAQRAREIGVRIALGARGGQVLRMILIQGGCLAVGGLLLGVAGALGLRRILAGLLFGIQPTDPAVFLVVAAVVALVSLAACYLPARRATRVDPLTAFRYE
jgi:putative ABC transport system permease protein